MMNEKLGAILTYHTDGNTGACGQIVGADGSGDQAVLIFGTPDNAYSYAKDFLKQLRDVYRISNIMLILNEEGYHGYPVHEIHIDGMKNK